MDMEYEFVFLCKQKWFLFGDPYYIMAVVSHVDSVIYTWQIIKDKYRCMSWVYASSAGNPYI